MPQRHRSSWYPVPGLALSFFPLPPSFQTQHDRHATGTSPTAIPKIPDGGFSSPNQAADMPVRTKLVTKSALRFPGLDSPPNHHAFIHNFVKFVENRKMLPTLDRSAVNDAYVNQLRQRYKHDDTSIRKYREEVKTMSNSDWPRLLSTPDR